MPCTATSLIVRRISEFATASLLFVVLVVSAIFFVVLAAIFFCFVLKLPQQFSVVAAYIAPSVAALLIAAVNANPALS